MFPISIPAVTLTAELLRHFHSDVTPGSPKAWLPLSKNFQMVANRSKQCGQTFPRPAHIVTPRPIC